MVVTRQGTVTAAGAAPAAAAASPAGPRARSPRRGGAQQRGASARKKGAPSPARKGPREARQGGASPKGTPRSRGTPAHTPLASPPLAKPRKGRTPRVQLASQAEVISPSSRAGSSSSSKGALKTRSLLKGGLLVSRMQTGPLPFVREMSGMSDLGGEGDPEGPHSAPEASSKAPPPSTLTRRSTSGSAAAAGVRRGDTLEAGSTVEAAAPDGRRSGSYEAAVPASLTSRSSFLSNSSSSSSRLSEGKLGQLLLTYFCYASLYLTRKPFASSKRELELQLGMTASALGAIDTAFLGAYAASQLLLAPALLGAPKGPSLKTILVAAYAVSAGCCFCIYCLPEALLSPFCLSVVWGLNGASQALAFPLIVALLSTWFSSRERGGVLGVWTTCQQVGSIFASYLTAELLTASSRKGALFGGSSSLLEASLLGAPNWRLAFLVPAVWVLGCALLMARGLRRAPQADNGLSRAATAETDAASPEQQQQQQQQGKSLFARTVGLSSIRRLCAAYFCVKLVRYSLLYWLPYYFEGYVNLTSSAAAYYCIYFDAGGVLGSVAVGWLSDRYMRGRRLLLLAPLCCLAGLSVAFLHYSVLLGSGGEIPLAAQAALLLAGAAIAAPDSVLGGTATADACADEPAGSAADLTAMASCIVNGSGSVGSIVQGLLTPVLLSNYGWDHVFYSLGATAAVGGLSLIPGAINDVRILAKHSKTE
ncbi:hypothetical protein Efla_006171 [Eimeria flavescens]